MIHSGGTFENWVLVVLYTALTGCGVGYFYRYKRINPLFWFILFHWLMAVGSIYLADMNRESDMFYVLLFFASKAVYLASAVFFWEKGRAKEDFRRFWAKDIEYDKLPSRVYVMLIVALSAIVTLAYYKAVGYNIFVNIVLGLAVDDFSSMRLAAYSGDTYYAAGYVNQFKNILLPVCVSILGGWAWLKGENFKLLVIIVVGGAFSVVALLGTGQRAFMAYAFVAMVLGISGIRDMKAKTVILPALAIFTLFSIMTSLYKTLDEDSSVVVQSILKSLERFFLTEQEGALGAFRHLYFLDSVLFEEWRDQLLGIFPGHKGSTLQHDLFYLVHGNDRGTEGYATVAGFYYNGGLPAAMACYVLLAWLHFSLYRRFLGGRRTVFRVFAYAALVFHCSIFVSGGPSTMINNGVVTLLILLVVRKVRFGMDGQRALAPSTA